MAGRMHVNKEKRSIRTTILTMLLGAAAASAQIAAAPASTLNVSFAKGVTSSGWIDCHVVEGLGILVPLKVNGHETTAYLRAFAKYLE
jgi:hypothetical protein